MDEDYENINEIFLSKDDIICELEETNYHLMELVSRLQRISQLYYASKFYCRRCDRELELDEDD